MNRVANAPVTRAEVEDFLFHEAALLDEWRLEEWLGLLCEDATYQIPPNDRPDGDPKDTLFILSDDIVRIRERVKRLSSPNCHAEHPHSRTRRLITNVRIVETNGDTVTIAANFICHRFRRYERQREYGGAYRYVLTRVGGSLQSPGSDANYEDIPSARFLPPFRRHCARRSPRVTHAQTRGESEVFQGGGRPA